MTAPDEITKGIGLLYKPGDVVELRVPKAGRLKTISGYYSDPEKLAEAVRKLSKDTALAGIYWTINPCVPACLARCPENHKPYAETTTNDSEIAARRWLPIDCDAKRVADVSSTEEEKAAAGELTSRILQYLHEEGFAGLVLADSGNGWHILIPVDLPNDADSTALCAAFLSALAQKFDTGKAAVDKKLSNASRVLKVYGTVARKGSNTRERPWRMSRIVSGGHHAPVARALLENIAALVKAPPKEEKQSGDMAGKIEEFLEWGNVQHGARMAYRDGLKWQLTCPFDESHRRPDAVVYRLAGGALGFTCSHNTCAGRDWLQFRALVEERKGARFQFSNNKSDTERAPKWDIWLDNLPAVREAEKVLIVESAKDVETAREKYGLVATSNPIGAGEWRDEFSDVLTGKDVTIIGGNEHAEQFAKSCYRKARSLAIAELPPGIKDLNAYAELGLSRESLLEILGKASPWKPGNSKSAERDEGNPWLHVEGMADFLKGEEEPDYLFHPVIVRGAVTNMYSPRGIGKTMWALFVAVMLALKGLKVLLIDRDNPRREIKSRLRSFGATDNLAPLKVISREHAPPLTDAQAWGEFPYADHDLVIVDSLDSAAEGVGEQDSAKPSKAIAPLLDIAHRENGPAVLVLGNCIKTGAHARGSGVIEDRADIVFEVRDCTNFHPTGRKPWVEELPPAAAADWASRSSRRKKQVKLRLAFIPTKFRVGEEPEPFIVELDLADEPWTVRNVTDEVDLEGKAEHERHERETAERTEHAKTALLEEINRRVEALEPPLYKERDAIPLLQEKGLTRKQSRQVMKAQDGSKWRLVLLAGEPGPPFVVLPLGYDFVANRGYIKVSGGGDTTPQKPAKNAGLLDVDLRRPHPEHPAEISPSYRVENKSIATQPISAATTNLQGRGTPEEEL
jgi:hypothetical protein